MPFAYSMRNYTQEANRRENLQDFRFLPANKEVKPLRYGTKASIDALGESG